MIVSKPNKQVFTYCEREREEITITTMIMIINSLKSVKLFSIDISYIDDRESIMDSTHFSVSNH